MSILSDYEAWDGDISALIPNGIALSDKCLDEVEREGGVNLEIGHRRWLRGTLPLDVHLTPQRIAETSPQLEPKRKARRRRLKRIAKFATLLSAEIAAEIADESQVSPSLQVNLWRIDRDVDVLAAVTAAVNKVALAARLQQAPREKPGGRWSPYAPYKDLVLQFAQIFEHAGGTPSSGWDEYRGDRRTAFWRAFQVINRELPESVRVNVDGLAQHAHRQKWFSKPAADAKPPHP